VFIQINHMLLYYHGYGSFQVKYNIKHVWNSLTLKSLKQRL